MPRPPVKARQGKAAEPEYPECPLCDEFIVERAKTVEAKGVGLCHMDCWKKMMADKTADGTVIKARWEQRCQACHEPIAPPEKIGKVPGLGWCHASCLEELTK